MPDSILLLDSVTVARLPLEQLVFVQIEVEQLYYGMVTLSSSVMNSGAILSGTYAGPFVVFPDGRTQSAPTEYRTHQSADGTEYGALVWVPPPGATGGGSPYYASGHPRNTMYPGNGVVHETIEMFKNWKPESLDKD